MAGTVGVAAPVWNCVVSYFNVILSDTLSIGWLSFISKYLFNGFVLVKVISFTVSVIVDSTNIFSIEGVK